MYAVIVTGGKQYRVGLGDRLAVERLGGAVGAMIALERVLMLGETGKAPVVGTPTVPKAVVFAEILAQEKGDKIVVFKKRRRKNYRRRVGHRQELTHLRILEVSPTGKAPAFTPTAAKAKTEARAKGHVPAKVQAKSKAKTKSKAKE